MLRNLSKRIVSFYIDRNLLQSGQRDWYIYTVEKALFNLLAWGPMLWVGWQTGGPWHTAVFLLGLTMLRKTAGGYHAHAWWQCLLASSALLAACNTILLKTVQALPLPGLLLLLLAAAGTVYLLAPLNHPAAPQTEAELCANRHRTHLVLLVESLLVVGLALRPGGKGVAASLLLGMSAAALLLVIAKITHQEVIEHESLEGCITESKCQND